MPIDLSEEDLAVVGMHLRASDKIRAVLVVRQRAGASLKEAVDYINDLQRRLDPPDDAESTDMGMTAQILAIGPFRDDLRDHMEYSAERYAGTHAGVPVLRFLFHCYGSTHSRRLAGCFGIDPWDFNQHKLDSAGVDPEKLRAFCEDDETDVVAFLALREAGFDFYFVPNG